MHFFNWFAIFCPNRDFKCFFFICALETFFLISDSAQLEKKILFAQLSVLSNKKEIPPVLQISNTKYELLNFSTYQDLVTLVSHFFYLRDLLLKSDSDQLKKLSFAHQWL